MTVRITLYPNGPIRLEAEGAEYPVLARAGGQDIRPEKPVHLCRCGHSRNKPYCDGSHAAAQYSDVNRCDREELRDFPAAGITVHFNRSICAGASECVKGLPSVFDSTSGDWIHPERAPVQEVVAAVARCPSGALTCTVAGAPAAPTTDAIHGPVTVRIEPDGPYHVCGPVEFAPPRWSHGASRTKFTLCRCGRSGNAPFCDYSHGETGWKEGS